MKNTPVKKAAIVKLIALIVLAGTAWAPAGEVSRVLFVGNSYTGVNNLPKIFKDIVKSTGAAEPEVKAHTPGGRTLAKHLGEPETIKLIDEGNWDVVVLQGQSQEAAISEVSDNIRSNFLKGANELCQRIKVKSPNVRIVFYQTWARHADYWKATKEAADVGKSPAEMQARNRKWYKFAAAQNRDCVVAPVGDAWELNYSDPGAARLHATDNSHPTFAGSYLAGLVMYATIYRTTNTKVSYRGSLAEAEAASLQRVAAQVLGSNGNR